MVKRLIASLAVACALVGSTALPADAARFKVDNVVTDARFK